MGKVKVELNRAGVRELLRCDAVKAMLESEANARAASAGAGYTVNSYVGWNRCNAEILAETREARKDNLKNNTLLKVIS